ncbi:MAG: phytochelatin synthase family protein [Chthoniobacteraceae bacterium]
MDWSQSLHCDQYLLELFGYLETRKHRSGNSIASLPGFHESSFHRNLNMSDKLVAFHSAEGRNLFAESGCKEAFWQLAQYYNTQPDPGSCGVASCMMVLNAMHIARPLSSIYGDHKLFTPANFFTPEVEAVVSRKNVSSSGMTLEQLARAIATYPVNVTCRHATPGLQSTFRNEIRESLQCPGEFVIVNYLRKVIGQQTGGHISPLGAYHEGADMALILDVSNYKYPWTWVKTEMLWQAMEAADNDVTRGYVIVTSKNDDTACNLPEPLSGKFTPPHL